MVTGNRKVYTKQESGRIHERDLVALRYDSIESRSCGRWVGECDGGGVCVDVALEVRDETPVRGTQICGSDEGIHDPKLLRNRHFYRSKLRLNTGDDGAGGRIMPPGEAVREAGVGRTLRCGKV